MNGLKKHLRDYLQLRRALGFELGRVESRLRGFLVFMKVKRARQITTKLAVEFALRSDRSASTQAGYLSAIRGFAQYLRGIEPKTEVPPSGLIRRGHRPQPYIYSDEEIIRILEAARQHPSTARYALKPHTLYCLFGLLSVTGMRLTEALNLRFEDIDWVHGVLTIGRAKFQKSRLVPLHQSALQELRTYIERRNEFFAERPGRRPVNRIFVSTHGGALTGSDVGTNFRMLTRQIGIRAAGASRGPRIHDLRHRFAVTTLLRWYRRGKKVDRLLPVLSTYLGHVFISGTYWYLTCTPELMGAAATRLERRWKGSNSMHKADLGTLVEAFFCKRLISQRRVSPHTIASYRDTFRLLLAFAQKRLSRPPSQLELKDISPSLVSDFLDHLEATRGNGARTRNLRLTAVRSFFRFAALEAPDHGGAIQRVLAIPNKRCQRPLIGFLTRSEIDALLAAVDGSTWIGRRDYAFLLVAMQTGMRLSELTAVRRDDVILGPGAHIHCVGKGRKERATPLTKIARRVLQAWMKEPWPIESAFLFPSRSGGRLSADAIQDLVNKHVAAAGMKCPSLVKKRVTPHVLRHTAAMELLQAGVDRSMIALWLGHESIETTQIYLNANLALKEEILAKTTPVNGKPGRYRPTDRVLSFLSSL